MLQFTHQQGNTNKSPTHQLEWSISKVWITSNVCKDEEDNNSDSLLVGMKKMIALPWNGNDVYGFLKN